MNDMRTIGGSLFLLCALLHDPSGDRIMRCRHNHKVCRETRPQDAILVASLKRAFGEMPTCRFAVLGIGIPFSRDNIRHAQPSFHEDYRALFDSSC